MTFCFRLELAAATIKIFHDCAPCSAIQTTSTKPPITAQFQPCVVMLALQV